MDEQKDRLQRARRQANYENASDAARAFGWVVSTYLSHENGTRSLNVESALKYSKAFRVNHYWLLTGIGNPDTLMSVPVVGYVGAGAVLFPADNHVKVNGLDMVEAPPTGDVAVIAVIVRGDSMFPAYRDGDIIFLDKEPSSAEYYLNKECVVTLPGGEKYLKTVTKGSQPGLYTLMSWNAPPIVDVEVESAVPVRWVQKR